MLRLLSVVIGCLCAGLLPAASALAQTPAADFPKQTIQIVVPFPPGGNTDLIARILAEGLQKAFKSPVVVVSKPGAGTNIGASFVANSSPDGYTLLLSAPASFVVNQFIYSTLAYDPDASFFPVSLAADFPNVLVVPPSLGVHSIRQLINKAKAQPGKITYASAGIGTSSHLAGALFWQMAGIKLLHVPYKGTSQTLQDLIPGRVDMTIDNLGPILPFIKSGQLTALGVSTKDPVLLLPGVPPIDSVLKGYTLTSWNVLAAPAGTPKDIVAKISAECDRILHTPGVIANLNSFGSRAVGGTPKQTAAFLKEERVRWEAAIRAADIKKGQFD
jgi:tripartite-type tricarboxylate transporter receptor subunit TctC